MDSAWRCSDQYPTVKDANGNTNNMIIVEAPKEDVSQTAKDDQSKKEMDEIDKIFNTDLPDNPCAIWNNYPQELPRQLVKTPLNQAVIERDYSPSVLLPIPEHVVLTHFFRQRKRKNYSVTACTCRYRGKYVTVVLYVTTDPEGHEEIPELTELFMKYK